MIKIYAITSLLLVNSLVTKAQYSELSAQLGSGLFSFRGSQVVQESFFNIVREASPANVGSASYTNDRWSSRSSFSWGMSMQAQHVSKNNFIKGFQLAYESLATKTTIVGGSDFGRFIPFQEGQSVFTYDYINLHPFVGQRFGNRQLSLDITIGLDAAMGLYNWEKGKGTTTANELYLTYHKYSIPGLDVRPRVDAIGYYGRVGLSISYAHGLTSYSNSLVGVSVATITSQLWRIGVIYRSGKK